MPKHWVYARSPSVLQEIGLGVFASIRCIPLTWHSTYRLVPWHDNGKTDRFLKGRRMDVPYLNGVGERRDFFLRLAFEVRRGNVGFHEYCDQDRGWWKDAVDVQP